MCLLTVYKLQSARKTYVRAETHFRGAGHLELIKVFSDRLSCLVGDGDLRKQKVKIYMLYIIDLNIYLTSVNVLDM